MKKRANPRLKLHRETLRSLTPVEAVAAEGAGFTQTCASICYACPTVITCQVSCGGTCDQLSCLNTC